MEELFKEFNNKKSLIVGDVFLIHQIFESIRENKSEPLKENKNGIFINISKGLDDEDDEVELEEDDEDDNEHMKNAFYVFYNKLDEIKGVVNHIVASFGEKKDIHIFINNMNNFRDIKDELLEYINSLNPTMVLISSGRDMKLDGINSKYYIKDEFDNFTIQEENGKFKESYTFQSKRLEHIPYQEPVTFSDIAGYDLVKKELLLVKSWWDDKEALEAKGISLPHSFLLHGPMGTGKSLFAKAFTSFFPDATIIKIDGTHSSEQDEITEKFNFARRQKGMAIILIDEIDLISRGETRNLLTELDGLGGDNKNIFVIATCNNMEDLYPPLLRRGRLDYLIGIGNPNEKERMSLLKYYFAKSGINVNQDYDYLAFITKGENAVNIKAIANEVRLRYGENPTVEEIEDIIDRINKREMEYYGDSEEPSESDRYLTAVHEVGHAVVVMERSKYFSFYKASIETNSIIGGRVKVLSTKEDIGDLNRALADLDISIGGYLAEKILFKRFDRGAQSDLEKARHTSAALVNTLGYKGLNPLLCHYANSIPTSPFKKYHNEKLSERILDKAVRRVTKIIKRRKKEILILADMLAKKGVLTKKDMMDVMGA